MQKNNLLNFSSYGISVPKFKEIKLFAIILFAIFLNAVFPILVARGWGAVSFGSFSGFWSIISIFSVGLLGVQTTIATHAEASINKEPSPFRITLDSYSKLLIRFGIGLTVFCFCCDFILKKSFFGLSFIFSLLGISVLSGILNAIGFGKIIALGRLSLLYKINLFLALIKIFTIIFAYLFNASVLVVIFFLILQQLLYSVVLFSLTESKAKVNFNFFGNRSLTTYIVSLSIWTMVYFDLLLIRFQVDSRTAGLFAVAASISKLLLLPLSLFLNITMGLRLEKQDVPSLRTTAFRRIVIRFLLTLGFFSILLSLFHKQIVAMLFGVEYLEISYLVPLIIGALLPNILSIFLVSLIARFLDKFDVLFAGAILALDAVILIALPHSINSFLVTHGLFGYVLLFFLEFRHRKISVVSE